MIITCDCKVKQNITSNLNNINLVQLNNIKKSKAFSIIKCYELFFSWENKLKNIGFWIFTIFILLHIQFLFLFFYKGIKSMKQYIEKIMEKNGDINNNNIGGNNNKKEYDKQTKNINRKRIKKR